MATMKQAAKGAVRGKGGKFVGAGRLEEARSIGVAKVKIEVDASDLERLQLAAEKLQGAVDASASLGAVQADPKEMQLYRRVVLSVYDAAGVRLSNTSFDLSSTDTLDIEVARGKTAFDLQSVDR